MEYLVAEDSGVSRRDDPEFVERYKSEELAINAAIELTRRKGKDYIVYRAVGKVEPAEPIYTPLLHEEKE